MMKKLDKNFRPSCIHDNKEPAYSSTGYILPCCWCDTGFLLQDEDFSSIVQDKFKLDNVDNISDIVESKCGIRAQAVDSNGKFIHDFLFTNTDKTLHVINAPSPAATSAFPIADHILRQIENSLR